MKFKPAIKPYQSAAGGWGSLEATTRFVLDSKQASTEKYSKLAPGQ